MPSTSRGRRRPYPAPAPPPSAVGHARRPSQVWVPRLPHPPPAAVDRRPHPAPDATPAIEPRARGPVWVPRRLPPPAAAVSARKPDDPAPRPVLPPNPSHPAPRPVATPNPSPLEHQSRTPRPSSSSSTRGHNPRNRVHWRKKDSEAAQPPESKARDWADLPLDAISAVLRKLDHVEILLGAGTVCRAWRSAARDDPSLWRRVDMSGHADLFGDLPGMARVAVRRARGQCEAFTGEYAADDAVLLLLAEQAPSLKSLHLISCYDVSNEGFAEAIKKLPLLEELELSLSKNVFGQEVFETVGKSCPHLKRFRLSEHGFYSFEDADYNKNGEALGIATMTELRSLQIFGNNLTNEGLTAILDSCCHLESLDIRHCFNVKMDNTLRAKCAGIKTLRLPNDSTDDYEFIISDPVWDNDSQTQSEGDFDGYMGYDGYYDLDTELGSDDDIYDPFNYIDGIDKDDEEARMILMSLWALMK